MLNPLSVLPLQLACQLLISQDNSTATNVHIDTQLPKSASELPDAYYTVYPEIGVAYKHYKNSLSWNAARRYCVAEGGNLAIIDSFKKIEYVKSINTDDSSVHVGIHRLFDTEWTDVKNGLPVRAIPWRFSSYNEETSKKCMGLIGNGDVGLLAVNCDEKLSFVCEVSLFKNSSS